MDRPLAALPRWRVGVGCLLLLVYCVSAAFADANDQKVLAQAKQPAKQPEAASVVSPEREAAVTTFVRLHHPELEALLSHLRDARPKEYEKALRELFRVTERLGQIQDRDAELYELELKMWKSQSRLQLLLARLQMHEDEGELRQQIEAAVQEQYDVRVAMLERQERKAEEQAKKAQDELKKLKSDREKWVSRQVDMFLKPTPTTKPEPKPESKPENKTDKNKAGKPTGKEPERQDDKQPETKPAKPKDGKPVK